MMPPSLPAKRAAAISQAVLRAADRLSLSAAALARTIGIPEDALPQLRAGTDVLEINSKAYELALLLVRVLRRLVALTRGDDASGRSWMNADNPALGGVPRDLIQTVVGLVAVLAYLDRAATGQGGMAFQPDTLAASVTSGVGANPAAFAALIDEIFAAARARALESAIGWVRDHLAACSEEQAKRFDGVVAVAGEVWRDAARARDWLTRPHMLLGGQTPLAMAVTDGGAARVEHILRNLQHGSVV
jgi:putative toxin-antitoxin system antitoxin component (TIGR02293 family)